MNDTIIELEKNNHSMWIIYLIFGVFCLIMLYICIALIKTHKEKGLLSKENKERLKQEKLEKEELAREFDEFEKGLPKE